MIILMQSVSQYITTSPLDPSSLPIVFLWFFQEVFSHHQPFAYLLFFYIFLPLIFLPSYLPYFRSSFPPIFLTSDLPSLPSSLLPIFLPSHLPYFWSSFPPIFLTSDLPSLSIFLSPLVPLHKCLLLSFHIFLTTVLSYSGCGKTALVQALSKKTNIPIIKIVPSTLLRKYVGDTSLLTKAIFTAAKKIEPCIIFIDEMDAMFRSRGDGENHYERNLITECTKYCPLMSSLLNRDKLFLFFI